MQNNYMIAQNKRQIRRSKLGEFLHNHRVNVLHKTIECMALDSNISPGFVKFEKTSMPDSSWIKLLANMYQIDTNDIISRIDKTLITSTRYKR